MNGTPRRPLTSIDLRARRIADAGMGAPGMLSTSAIREAVFKAALVELRAAIAEEREIGI